MKDSIKAELLKNSPLFSELSEARLLELSAIARVVHLKKGETLFVVDEPAQRLFVIASGTIRAIRANSTGREQVLHVETAGATLAEVAIFDDGPYPATAAAEVDSVLLSLDRTLLKEFCFRYPEVAWSALRILAGRLRHHAELIDQLALQDVVPRLARFLLSEAESRAIPLEAGATLTIELTHQQLAARIGSVREVVSRSLRRLEKNGVISLDERHPGSKGSCIVLLDTKALKSYAESPK